MAADVRIKLTLNLLACRAGGQITRANKFLDYVCALKNVNLTVLCPENFWHPCFELPQVRVVILPFLSGKFSAIRRTLWEAFCMPRFLLSLRCEVFITFSHFLPPTFPKAVKSVVGVSNLAPFIPKVVRSESFFARVRMHLLRMAIISSANRADLIVALSEYCESLLRANGVKREKIIVAPNGVDPAWGEPEPYHDLAALGIVRPYLLYVSHFHFYKNHMNLLRAFSNLLWSYPDRYQLVLVGDKANMRYFQSVLRLISVLGLTDAVVVLPGQRMHTLRALYQQAELFVFPSVIENSPNIFLEALSAGAPTIASRQSPMPEFGGEACKFFDAYDHVELSACMEKVLSDSNLLQSLRQGSSERASRYTWLGFSERVMTGAISLLQ